MATSTAAPTTLSGEKTVTAAGTAEKIATGHRFSSISITPKLTNTGNVYVGGSDVASTTNDGIPPGDTLELVPGGSNSYIDGDAIFIDVDTSGEGVDFYGAKA